MSLITGLLLVIALFIGCIIVIARYSKSLEEFVLGMACGGVFGILVTMVIYEFMR